jgi:hypothetical protein
MWCGRRGNQKRALEKHVKKRYSTIHEIQNDKVESLEKNVREE